MTNLQDRTQRIENALRIAMKGLAAGRVNEFPSDHMINKLAKCFDGVSGDDQFKVIVFVVSKLLPDIPDISVRELSAAMDIADDEAEFESWILAELHTIGIRHGATADETVGQVLDRAAAAGDQQATKLIDMGIGLVKTHRAG